MLQEFNQQQNVKLDLNCSKQQNSDLVWWRTWTSSWWANVYF
ncbi:Trp operon leader peptide [Vibrio intestinalis]|nr:Trp operon leader peptide [Vibrio intestinalis]